MDEAVDVEDSGTDAGDEGEDERDDEVKQHPHDHGSVTRHHLRM